MVQNRPFWLKACRGNAQNVGIFEIFVQKQHIVDSNLTIWTKQLFDGQPTPHLLEGARGPFSYGPLRNCWTWLRLPYGAEGKNFSFFEKWIILALLWSIGVLEKIAVNSARSQMAELLVIFEPKMAENPPFFDAIDKRLWRDQALVKSF